MLFTIPIFGGILMTMLVKARPFIPVPMPGEVRARIKLNFWQKMMVHRISLYALGVVLVLGLIAGWLNGVLEWSTMAIAFAILLMPMNYTFTSKGVAVGDVIFRTWKEFDSFVARGGRITLKHPARFSSLTLYVTPAEREKVLMFISRRIQPQSFFEGVKEQ